MGRDEPEFPCAYLDDDDIAQGMELIATKDVSDLRAAIEVMRMDLDCRLRGGGGYPADVDYTTHPQVVVVADIEGSDAGSPYSIIYSREKLERLGREIRERAVASFSPCDPDGVDWPGLIVEFDFPGCEWPSGGGVNAQGKR